jgi:hypothetical protein
MQSHFYPGCKLVEFPHHLCKYRKIKNIKRKRPQSDSTSKSANSSILLKQNIDKRFRDRPDASNKNIDDTVNDVDMNLSIEVDILANTRAKISKEPSNALAVDESDEN